MRMMKKLLLAVVLVALVVSGDHFFCKPYRTTEEYRAASRTPESERIFRELMTNPIYREDPREFPTTRPEDSVPIEP